MSILSLKKANCKNCYKCVRVCPVKSIHFKEEQAEIMPHDCILCGHCLEACPQNAKTITSDLENVKKMIASDYEIFVSLAPSFIGSFEFKDPGQIIGALKALGFTEVLETSQGAVVVTDDYYKQLKEKKMNNIISSCCPTINEMVEKYYPELVGALSPTVSPMIAHARMIKEKYGHSAKVVFIGPCISKIGEANDIRHDTDVDAVLTFDELSKWFESEGIIVSEQQNLAFNGSSPKIARMYPIMAGVVKTLEKKGDNYDYNLISIDGIKKCMEFLSAMKDGAINNTFVEMTACTGSCVHGPMASSKSKHWVKDQIDVTKYADSDNDVYPEVHTNISLYKKFMDNRIKQDIPDEETIKAILSKIGKEAPEQELNCGFCGYNSCRDKAIAVYQNKAQLYMCMPYMSEMSQSMSNIILTETVNAIVVVDVDMKIREFNPAAEIMFKTSRCSAVKKYLYELIDTSNFEFVLQTKHTISDKKVSYSEYGNITTLQSITYVPVQNVIMGVFKDITSEQANEEKMYKLKIDTIDMAQKVINKQMVVAQEIASLLGETTAETKVTLTKLKDMIIYNGENEI